MDELKPCPFCGGTAVILDEPTTEDSYAVICNTKCGAVGPEDENGEYAIQFWNTRPLEDALLKRIKELEDLAEAQSKYMCHPCHKYAHRCCDCAASEIHNRYLSTVRESE